MRSARLAAVLVALGCAGAITAVACSDSYSSAPETAAEAGVDASGEGGAREGQDDPCAHASPPTSSTADEPGASLPPFVVALTSEAPDAGGVDPGFDLDGVCTCEARPGTAHDGGESCTRPKGSSPACDSDGGGDNNLGNLFEQFGSFYPLAKVLGEQIDKGRANILLQIGDYNGHANDSSVTVALFASQGIRAQGCASSTFDSAFGTWAPGWCGDDAWTITSDSVIGGTYKAPVVVGQGYVKDWVLVARVMGSSRMPFTDEYAVAVLDPIVTGKLVPLGEDLKPRDPTRAAVGREPRLWRVEGGRVGSRIPVREIVTGIGVTKVASDGGNVQLCTQSSFTAVKTILCASPDVNTDKAKDFDPTASCDAVSAGVPFTAAPVLIGDVYDRTRKPGPCDPGPNGDPLDAGSVTYSCPTK